MDGKWHSEQTSRLDTYGVELTGGYAAAEGFLRRATLSYGYITTDRNTEVVARSAMDFTTATAVIRTIRRRATLPFLRCATTNPISCSTAVCRGEKASAGSMSMPRTSPILVTAIWAASACPAHGSRAAWC